VCIGCCCAKTGNDKMLSMRVGQVAPFRASRAPVRVVSKPVVSSTSGFLSGMKLGMKEDGAPSAQNLADFFGEIGVLILSLNALLQRVR